MEQTFQSRDGFRIAYRVDDFTDPWTLPQTLLLLHAAMGSMQRWFRWVPRLARHFRVVRMDLRGHGGSQMPTPDQPFSGGGHRTGAFLNANSICAFNGLNDMNPDQGPIHEITQNPHNPGSPGDAGHGTCRGGTNFERAK